MQRYSDEKKIEIYNIKLVKFNVLIFCTIFIHFIDKLLRRRCQIYFKNSSIKLVVYKRNLIGRIPA